MDSQQKKGDCLACGIYNCDHREKSYPRFCLTTNTDKAEFAAVADLYRNDPFVAPIARAAAEVEGQYYGKLTRVEEIIVFAKKIGAQKIVRHYGYSKMNILKT
jgi:uncharacterized metal-binding protein